MNTSLANDLNCDRFLRSNRYDPKWIIENQMGLNPLWLTEWLCEKLLLQPELRVLDLSCGRRLAKQQVTPAPVSTQTFKF